MSEDEVDTPAFPENIKRNWDSICFQITNLIDEGFFPIANKNKIEENTRKITVLLQGDFHNLPDVYERRFNKLIDQLRKDSFGTLLEPYLTIFDDFSDKLRALPIRLKKQEDSDFDASLTQSEVDIVSCFYTSLQITYDCYHRTGKHSFDLLTNLKVAIGFLSPVLYNLLSHDINATKPNAVNQEYFYQFLKQVKRSLLKLDTLIDNMNTLQNLIYNVYNLNEMLVSRIEDAYIEFKKLYMQKQQEKKRLEKEIKDIEKEINSLRH